jgi:hypothetical protein
VQQLRDEQRIDDIVLRQVQAGLDAEEIRLSRATSMKSAAGSNNPQDIRSPRIRLRPVTRTAMVHWRGYAVRDTIRHARTHRTVEPTLRDRPAAFPPAGVETFVFTARQ